MRISVAVVLTLWSLFGELQIKDALIILRGFLKFRFLSELEATRAQYCH